MNSVRRRRFIFQATIFCAAVLAAFFVFPLSSSAKTSRKARGISARSAIFSNSTKVKRYYGKNVHMRVQPASTTKVMTALLVLEKLSLDKTVTMSTRASKAQPSKLAARPGERFTVRNLLHAILLKSANDASIALAEAVAGSEWEFVRMMNQKAKSLGARNTRFANASGLPTPNERQYTTAYDMYLIFRAALKYDFFKAVIQKKYATITSLNGRSFALKSHNQSLFFKNWGARVYGKTGWTRAAQACFVGYLMRGNDVCIIAVFGCTRRWDDIRAIIRKYGKMKI